MKSVTERDLTRKNETALWQRHYDVGFALYMQRLGPEHCHNEAQRRGWDAANRAEAEATTTAFFATYPHKREW